MYTRLALGSGQSEPYSCTYIEKKHTSCPSTCWNARMHLERYGKVLPMTTCSPAPLIAPPGACSQARSAPAARALLRRRVPLPAARRALQTATGGQAVGPMSHANGHTTGGVNRAGCLHEHAALGDVTGGDIELTFVIQTALALLGRQFNGPWSIEIARLHGGEG